MHPSAPTVAAPAETGAAAALERSAHLAVLAASVHDTQPWRLELHDDRLVVRADRSRQLTALDPSGRELVQSVGAALFTLRVGLAAEGWAADVDRFPDPEDPDLVAVVRCAGTTVDAGLADLAPAVPLRTNRRAFRPGQLPHEVLRGLVTGTAAEGALLVPVLHDTHRRLLARLTQQADRLQHPEPGSRDGLRRGGDRPREEAETTWGMDATVLVLATGSDDPLAWLRCGEAMQRVLLELTALGWAASPFPQVIEVPLTRTQLRSALAWDAHPQLVLRVGYAQPTPATPRRRISEVVVRPS